MFKNVVKRWTRALKTRATPQNMYKVPHIIEHNLTFLYKIFSVEFRFLFGEKKKPNEKKTENGNFWYHTTL